MEPEQEIVEPDIDGLLEYVAQNVWISIGLVWVIFIVAAGESVKSVFDLIFGADHPKRAGVMKLTPQIIGIATGWYVAPLIAETTNFAAVGTYEGFALGLVAGWGAIGAYELGRETRPLRMLKLIIRGVFERLYAMVTKAPLSKEKAAELDRTVKEPPVDHEKQS